MYHDRESRIEVHEFYHVTFMGHLILRKEGTLIRYVKIVSFK